MAKGGGSKVIIGCGCFLVLGIIFLLFLLMFYYASDTEFDEDVIGKLSESSLTDEGKEFLEHFNDELTKKYFPAAQKTGIHWVYLAAIKELDVNKDDQDSCDDYWIGPMKVKELNWSGNQLLDEYPDAKTDFSNCGDINDKFQKQLKELKKLDSYRDQSNENLENCLKKAREEKKEMFCQPHGVDSNDDKKADPFDDKDAITSVANLLATYREVYGNLGQALNLAYGENEQFLRELKNKVLTWLKDPSPDGILRWPLKSKVVTKRFNENENKSGLTIEAEDGEQVFAVGRGSVTEVGSDPSCGEYIKLTHDFYENNQPISTIICNLTGISVKKGDIIEIGDEIGKVKQQSLTIKMVKEKEEDQQSNSQDKGTNENQDSKESQNSNPQSDKEIYINPEEYLAVPDDVEFPKEEEEQK